MISLQGSVSVGESIELPALKITKPVRSMQMFKRPMNKVRQLTVDPFNLHSTSLGGFLSLLLGLPF